VPVTARLSKDLYDQLGEKLALELVDWFNQVHATSRADLRELNELNFGRFDAKLEQRLAEVEARLDRRFVELEARIEKKLVELEGRIDRTLVEFEARIDRKLVELEARVDKKFVELESRMNEKIVTAIADAKLSLIRWMVALWATQLLTFVVLWMNRGS
jgi:hypothetical protein